MSLTNNILDAIDILAKEQVSSVKFDKTVRATITEVVDASIGKYKVKYQNSTFFAYALDLKAYSKGTNVYIVIPSSDFQKDPYILGTVKKLGSDYKQVLKLEDKISLIGNNVLSSLSTPIEFCSFKSNDNNTNKRDLLKEKIIFVNNDSLKVYKDDSEYLLIGATFKTALPQIQQFSGQYGLKVTCQYGDPRYKSLEASEGEYITRQYVLNIDNMSGQPYNYTVGSEQFAVFEIDSANLKSIDSIEVFCNGFPNNTDKTVNIFGYLVNNNFYENEADIGKEEKIMESQVNAIYYDKYTKAWYIYDSNNQLYIDQSDIFISNIRCKFYDALSEEELQGISLRILTPLGGYFYEDDNGGIFPSQLQLEADLRIRGKKVNYNEQQVSFYWFVRDNRVDADGEYSKYYSRYAGPGWRCLNTNFQTNTGNGVGFNADTFIKTIEPNDKTCPAYETQFCCVALFKQDNDTVQIGATKIIYNQSKKENNNVCIVSTMGDQFDFDIGKTDLRCYIDGLPSDKEDEILDGYTYSWMYSIDGAPPIRIQNNETRILKDIDISMGRYFIKYDCSIYKIIKIDENNQEEIFIGSGSITLVNNKETNGQYRLVLNNGVQVFKYDENGVSPASPSVDEVDRIDMATLALSFDIYNDKGQLIQMEDTKKHRMMDIKWIWPDTGGVNPSEQVSDFTSMLIPLESIPYTFEEDILNNPYNGTSQTRWVINNDSQLAYGIQNEYDVNKTNNTIRLEVNYKGQLLIAETNFTFTKEGEIGTNGTKYTARIIPKEYQKIIICHFSEGDEKHLFGLCGVNSDYILEKLNTNKPFNVQLWDGGNFPIRQYNENEQSYVTWSTILDGRDLGNDEEENPISQYLTIDEKDGSISIDELTTNYYQNNTIKVDINDPSISQQHFYAEYPIDVITYHDPEDIESIYYVDGGYRTCSYKTDGTRGSFSTKGMKLKHSKDKEIDESKITWTNSWGGLIYTKELFEENKPISAIGTLTGYNDVVCEPPAYYDGSDENINSYIECKYNEQTVCILPINFYLNKYGLANINGWDGTSIKLNSEGSNYILAPQVGAGSRDTDGAFTGITIGKSFENGEIKEGLFGYHEGQRSIFLDSETGSAEFGKSGAAQIKIDTASNEGTIQSGDYPTNSDGKAAGMKIKFSSTGIGADMGPYIKFGSGNFSVDAGGNITAVSGGRIGSWYITNNNILANNADIKNATIYLNGNPPNKDYPYMLKAGAHFSVAADGTITASQGSIGGWRIGPSSIYAVSNNEPTGVTLNSDGYIGGAFIPGSNKTIRNWEIAANGVATFKNVIINNSGRTSTSNQSQMHWTQKNEAGEEETIFRVTTDGSMIAQKATITGKVTANELIANNQGYIAGWKISPNAITASNISIQSNGQINIGSGFVLSSKENGGGGRASGALKSRGGSNIGSGHVFPGGEGGNSGGEKASWQKVSFVTSLTALTTDAWPTYKDSTGGACTRSTSGPKYVYQIDYVVKELQLLVDVVSTVKGNKTP